MNKLRVLDLFSGIGGFSLGLERTGGFETVAFCEIDPYCQRVLAKHWPGVTQHNDVTTAPSIERGRKAYSLSERSTISFGWENLRAMRRIITK